MTFKIIRSQLSCFDQNSGKVASSPINRKKKGTKYHLADIDYFYRLILKIEKDTCFVIDVGPHDIERKY